MLTLPTPSAFAIRQREAERQYKRAVIKTCAVGIAGLACGLTLMAVNPRKTQGGWLGYVGVFLMLVSVFVTAVFTDRQRIITARRAGAVCPNCTKPLVQLNGKLAITSGRCPVCGERVLVDGPRLDV